MWLSSEVIVAVIPSTADAIAFVHVLCLFHTAPSYELMAGMNFPRTMTGKVRLLDTCLPNRTKNEHYVARKSI